jgi:F-type H+-transporting ATPase subunit b
LIAGASFALEKQLINLYQNLIFSAMAILAFAGVQLIPDGTLLIHIALILIMIWILNRTFFRPINRVIASREKNSGGRVSEAQEILNQVQKKNAAIDLALREARSEGYELIEKQRSKAVAKRQKKVAAVKEEVTTLLVTEKDAIARQSAEAQNVVAAEAQQMAEKISSNILKA